MASTHVTKLYRVIYYSTSSKQGKQQIFVLEFFLVCEIAFSHSSLWACKEYGVLGSDSASLFNNIDTNM
jgi:hypothetical protein